MRCALGCFLGVEKACCLRTAVASGVAWLSVPVRSCAEGCLLPSHSSGQVWWHSGHGKLGTLHVPGQRHQQDNHTVHGIQALWIRLDSLCVCAPFGAVLCMLWWSLGPVPSCVLSCVVSVMGLHALLCMRGSCCHTLCGCHNCGFTLQYALHTAKYGLCTGHVQGVHRQVRAVYCQAA